MDRLLGRVEREFRNVARHVEQAERIGLLTANGVSAVFGIRLDPFVGTEHFGLGPTIPGRRSTRTARELPLCFGRDRVAPPVFPTEPVAKCLCVGQRHKHDRVMSRGHVRRVLPGVFGLLDIAAGAFIPGQAPFAAGFRRRDVAGFRENRSNCSRVTS